MIIIGITGTLGAGKGTIVEFLAAEKGFLHFPVRKFISDEILRRGMPVNRDSMVIVANDLRKSHSSSYIVDSLYEKAKSSGKDSVIESIRTPGEVDSLRSKGEFYLLAIDADPKIRYERIKSRASETDYVSYKEFLENERREMNSTDPNAQNIGKCIEMADYRLFNNGTIEELNRQIDEIMQRITI